MDISDLFPNTSSRIKSEWSRMIPVSLEPLGTPVPSTSMQLRFGKLLKWGIRNLGIPRVVWGWYYRDYTGPSFWKNGDCLNPSLGHPVLFNKPVGLRWQGFFLGFVLAHFDFQLFECDSGGPLRPFKRSAGPQMFKSTLWGDTSEKQFFHKFPPEV